MAPLDSPPRLDPQFYPDLLGGPDPHPIRCGDKGDAGNLYVSKGSHKELERAFASTEGDIGWSPSILAKYGISCAAPLTPVLLNPGQAVLMQYQTVHGIGPNNTDTDRIQIYFRVTADGRPSGCKIHYPAAMRNVSLELQGLVAAVAKKRRAGEN